MEMEVIRIRSWFADSNDLPKRIKGTTRHTTEKAVLFNNKGKDIWIPKSVIVDETLPKEQQTFI